MTEGLVLSGRYRLVRQLGAGGMGSVWLSHDLNLGASVAIKLLEPSIAESPEAVARFRQEAQSAAMIRSTHVVQILDHGVDQGRPYIAMELLEGENLGQRLEREGYLPPTEVGHILGQVGRALSIAHSRGIVHRDLKPDNIFLVREGDEEIAKVVDFGVARRMTGLSDSSLSKTRTGTMLGTPYYMSPEQATGQSADHSTDIWALGVIACECLTGQRAFEGDSLGSLFHAICMQPIPKPSDLGTVPQGFDEWFAHAAERDKSRRFASMKEASDELRAICGLGSARNSAATLADYSPNSSHNVPVNTASSAVAAISTGLKRTAPPSSVTIQQRVRKRPILALSLGVIALATLSYAGWVLLFRRVADVPASVAAATAAASASDRSPQLGRVAEPNDVVSNPLQGVPGSSQPALSVASEVPSATTSRTVPVRLKVTVTKDPKQAISKTSGASVTPVGNVKGAADGSVAKKPEEPKPFTGKSDNAAGI